MVERRGGRGYVPDLTPSADTYLRALEDCLSRPRPLEITPEVLDQTLALARRLSAALGADRSAWIFMEAERRYWQARNAAGHLQYQRQNALGLGWANHDHHTFRSSRRCFGWLIDVLGAMGFLKRERFYAGEEAGWGAQVMEQPGAGLVIFADVDLKPEDIQVDFASEPMTDLQKPGTIGLWCALHGESLLKSGMHHLEAQFDFDQLRTDLASAGVQTMNPFSDFPHLRQAFTQGALWPVDPERLRQLHERGALGTEAYERIAKHGAVGSHLENLQRREGFKGFNQKAVSQIIREVNPERQAMN